MQTTNALLKRPAHDAWGIKKIVFVFCDDFLQKVLELPWSRQDEWRRHLLPIYQSIGVSEDKIIRSLLVSNSFIYYISTTLYTRLIIAYIQHLFLLLFVVYIYTVVCFPKM